MRGFIAMLGRFCLSAIFITSGLAKIVDWQGTEQYIISAIQQAQHAHAGTPWLIGLLDTVLPWSSMLVLLAIFAEIFGGLLVFLGILVRFGALVLTLYLIPLTFLFHNFWDFQGADRTLQMIMFMKNLSIFGGLLILLAYGKAHCATKVVKEKHIDKDKD